MFDPLPEGADVYIVSIVIGDRDDEKAAAILRRCAEAAGTRGRVLIVEALLEEDPAAAPRWSSPCSSSPRGTHVPRPVPCSPGRRGSGACPAPSHALRPLRAECAVAVCSDLV